MDHNKVMEFLGQFVADLGATGAAGPVVIGNRLGLYRVAGAGPGDARAVRRAHRLPPALPHRVAARPGRRRVRQLRPGDRRVLADRGAGVLPGRSRTAPTCRRRSSRCWATCVPNRGSPRRSAPAPASAGTSTTDDVFVGMRRVLPARLRRRAGTELDPGAGRRRGEADRRGPGGRPRLRPRLLVGAARRGLPAHHRRRLGLPPRVDRTGAQEGRRGRRHRPGQLRGGHRADLHRQRTTTW